MSETKIVTARCVKCRENKEELMTKEEVKTSKGIKYGLRGVCSKCGTKMFKFTSKDG